MDGGHPRQSALKREPRKESVVHAETPPIRAPIDLFLGHVPSSGVHTAIPWYKLRSYYSSCPADFGCNKSSERRKERLDGDMFALVRRFAMLFSEGLQDRQACQSFRRAIILTVAGRLRSALRHLQRGVSSRVR